MIGDIAAKALIVVKADTSQAKAAIKDLSATEQKAAKERVEAQEKANAAYERSTQKFALYAAGGVAAFSILSAGVKKYEEHLKAMGPAGAAELKKIDDASKQLTKAQDTLLIAIGKLAMVAAPAATELAKMAESLAGIVGGIGAIVERAKSLPGAGTAWKVGKFATKYVGPQGLIFGAGDAYNYFSGPDQSVAPTSMDMSGAEGGGGAEFGNVSLSPSQARAAGWVNITGPGYNYWRPPTDAEKQAREQKRKAGAKAGAKQADIYADAWRGLGLNDTAGFGLGGQKAAQGVADQSIFDMYETEAKQDPAFALKSQLAAAMEASKQFDAQMKELAAVKEQSMLNRIFGPVGEFDVYANAFGTLKTAVGAAFQAWIDGSMGAGEAFKKAVAASLSAQAVELAGLAIVAGAHGIYHLATGNPKGIAELAAAGKAAAGAVALGALAKTLGGNGSVPSSNANAAAGIGGRGGSTGTQQTSLTVVMGDSFAGDSPRYVARKTRRNMENARRYADYEGAVPG